MLPLFIPKKRFTYYSVTGRARVPSRIMQILDVETLNDPQQLYGLLFCASWAEPSLLAEQLLDDQEEEYPSISFAKVNVDEHEELVKLFGVSSVPTVIFLKNGQIVGKHSGADPMALLAAVKTIATSADSTETLEDRLKALVNRHPFMIFIKGTPEQPRCGFTGTLLRTLRDLQIEFDSFDILADDEIRQGLKAYSQWPTYPQIYVKGELLGGLDIFLDMHRSGQLGEVIESLKE